MKGTEDTRKMDRYIALDIHKEYMLAGGTNSRAGVGAAAPSDQHGEVSRMGNSNLHEGDAVVIETTTNVWDIYDLVGCAGLGAGVHDSGKEHIEKRITKRGGRWWKLLGRRSASHPTGKNNMKPVCIVRTRQLW